MIATPIPRRGRFVGGLLGLAVVVLLLGSAHGHEDAGQHAFQSRFIDTFVALTLESAPALLLAYLLAGIMSCAITPARANWLQHGSATTQSLKGVLFGLPLPICSCGVLPLYETLVRRGVPATAAVAFLIATPELGIDAMLLSLPLLGPQMTLARLVAAFGVAMLVALFVGRMVRARPAEQSTGPASEQTASMLQRLRDGLRYGLVDLFDNTMPWVLAGLLIAALVEPVLGHVLLRQIPRWLQVPLFGLIGIPLYVCASGATPLAAVAIYKGISPGAALAFLLAGPATNVTTFGVLRQLHGRRIAAVVGVSVTLAAMAMGWLVDLLAIEALLQLPGKGHQHASPLQWLALAALACLSLLSLFRQGPRGLIEQVISPIKPTSNSEDDCCAT